MKEITYPYGFVPNLSTIVKWDCVEQLIPRPDLTDIESKIRGLVSDIDTNEINAMLKSLPGECAYIDWDKIQLSGLPISVPPKYEANRLYLQFPVAAICVDAESPITNEWQRKLDEFLRHVGYRQRGRDFMGDVKFKKEYLFYEVEMSYKDTPTLSRLLGSFAEKFSIWDHNAD